MTETQHSALSTQHSALVTVENLSFQYDGAAEPTLRGVNLTIQRGEMMLLLGPSGAGKSTLALCLNGLIPQQIDGTISGRILVVAMDTQTSRVADLCQRVGLVFQDPDAQLALLKVADEVAFGPENLRLPTAEVEQRVAASLAATGLTGQDERDISTLSGGNKQRLTTAAMLALRPALLVFDEPTANLDPAAATHFFALCATLRDAGTTILIIEHRLDELIGYVDRIAVMNHSGTIQLIATPTAVFGNPQTATQLQAQGIWLPQVTSLVAELESGSERLPTTIAEAAATITQLTKVRGNCPPYPLSPLESQNSKLETQNSAISINNLSYRYPDSDNGQALRGISLEVGLGEFFAIVGPNGSGKSTLAAHLVGLIKPPRGKVTVLGREVSHLPKREVAHLVGYVFQNPEHQFVTRTVYDELAFGLRGLKLAEDEVQRRVAAAMHEFALVGLDERNPFSLSQGQKRRLSVATMLLVGQQVLILDEPTFGQDAVNANALMQRLRQLQQRGITIVMITHDMRLVAEYADRVTVLRAGEVAFVGPPRNLFADTALLHTASLTPPTLYTLSQVVRQQCPNFPLLAAKPEYLEYLRGGRPNIEAN